jgi:hypothetical protein
VRRRAVPQLVGAATAVASQPVGCSVVASPAASALPEPEGGAERGGKNVESKNIGTFSKILINISRIDENFLKNVGFNIFIYINVGATFSKKC